MAALRVRQYYLGWKPHFVGGRGDLPRFGMGSGERHSYFERLRISDTDIRDLAHLLSLCRFIKRATASVLSSRVRSISSGRRARSR